MREIHKIFCILLKQLHNLQIFSCYYFGWEICWHYYFWFSKECIGIVVICICDYISRIWIRSVLMKFLETSDSTDESRMDETCLQLKMKKYYIKTWIKKNLSWTYIYIYIRLSILFRFMTFNGHWTGNFWWSAWLFFCVFYSIISACFRFQDTPNTIPIIILYPPCY